MPRTPHLLFFGWSLTLALGCGSPPPLEELYPVKGSVTFAAPTPATALVVFHPLNAKTPQPRRPFGALQSDGTFQLSTLHANDGAPPGEYAVTLTWELPGNGDLDEVGPDLLKGSPYADPARTPLRATVEQRPNEFSPFIIKK